uniref:Uncharacterized protein n=1 Tax=Sphaerodactylus townsendi TaxID=933632 RepID=A0ACB8EL12_9SAUR
MVTRESDADGMSVLGEDVCQDRRREKSQGSQGSAQQRKQLPKFKAGGDQSLKRSEKPQVGDCSIQMQAGEKPGMKSLLGSYQHPFRKGREQIARGTEDIFGKRLGSHRGMGSIAVIQHQKIGGKEIVPQEQELSDDSMRSGQMNISSLKLV